MNAAAPGDLIFRALTPADAEGEHAALVRGYGQAVVRGFHEGRMSDEQVAIWLDGATADSQRFRGAWPEETMLASPNVPVATYTSWTGGGLNVGADRSLPLHMITDVTVSPTHRRRGLLRTLMHDDLRDAAARGLPLAALTSTEGTIYGRFGFGPATRLRAVDIDVTGRFALRDSTDEGSLELLEPTQAWSVLREVQRRIQASTRGALEWPAFYEPSVTGRFSWDEGGPDHKLRIVVHLDSDGRPDGFATWRHRGEQDGLRTADVGDVIAETPAGYLALWQFLGGLDLTQRLRWGRAPLVDPLEWALVDPRCVSTTKVRDMLWIRVLDVVAALEARPWYADGMVVLGIDDPVGLIGGSWRVEVTGGLASVTPTDAEPEVRLAAETLGSLYLGGVDVATLAAGGRLAGPPDAVDTLASMMDGGPAPYCATGF